MGPREVRAQEREVDQESQSLVTKMSPLPNLRVQRSEKRNVTLTYPLLATNATIIVVKGTPPPVPGAQGREAESAVLQVVVEAQAKRKSLPIMEAKERCILQLQVEML